MLLGLISNEVKATLWYALKLSILPAPPVAAKLTAVPVHKVPGVVVVTMGVGNAVTVIVAIAPVIAVVLVEPFALVIDVKVYTVLTAGFGFALNGVPLTMPE
jgi:hypothetical protein